MYDLYSYVVFGQFPHPGISVTKDGSMEFIIIIRNTKLYQHHGQGYRFWSARSGRFIDWAPAQFQHSYVVLIPFISFFNLSYMKILHAEK
jgi:hypothetical protein